MNKFFEWIGTTDNVDEYLIKTDIYCQPSRNEALGFTIMEAMTMRIPIIATDVGGIAKLVIDEVNGYLVKPEDSKDMANKFKILIENIEKREMMGEKSRELISNSKFSTEKM